MEHNFNQHITDGDDIGPYDFGSIMHYSTHAFSRNNQPTIETINGESIGQRNGLSKGDIQAVNFMYPFEQLDEIDGEPVITSRGDLSDVTAANLRINLFVRGDDENLWERYWDGSNWGWSNTRLKVDSDPVILAYGDINGASAGNVRVNVFVKGNDGNLWERFWNGAEWNWSNTGLKVDGKPAILARGNVRDASAGNLRVNLFVRGDDGNLWERFWNGAQWNWSNTRLKVDGDPVIFAYGDIGDASAGNLRVNLFVRGDNGKLRERFWNGASWITR